MTAPICIDIDDTDRLYALARLAAADGYLAITEAAHAALRTRRSANLHRLYRLLQQVPEATRVGWPIFAAIERTPT